jgi:hypothetical protein
MAHLESTDRQQSSLDHHTPEWHSFAGEARHRRGVRLYTPISADRQTCTNAMWTGLGLVAVIWLAIQPSRLSAIRTLYH